MSGLIDAAEAIVLFIIVLGVLVLFHESGHFFTARLARVRVLEFGFGFPPRAKVMREGPVDPDVQARWERKRAVLLDQAGDDPAQVAMVEAMPGPLGMQYTLNWLPIGGFVKLEGEDGDQDDDPRSFSRARLPVKLLILFMGVVMNLVLSVLIFGGIAFFGSPYLGVQFAEVEQGSPAATAGLQPGDTIVSINGQMYDFYATRYADGSLLDQLRAHAGQTIQLGVVHADGTTSTIPVTLRTADEIKANAEECAQTPSSCKGVLGIKAGDAGFKPVFLSQSVQRPLGESLQIGWSETTYWFSAIIDGLASLGSSIVNNPTTAPPVSGPVGIATSLGDTFRNEGPLMTLYVAGILSANLALVNVLPFPPLDGGRMLVIVLKAIPGVGRRISLRAEQLTYAIGFVALFGFIIWVTFFDIARGLGGGGTP
jgi:regulator of sigma E protease